MKRKEPPSNDDNVANKRSCLPKVAISPILAKNSQKIVHSRMNWGSGKGLEIITNAVHEYDNNIGTTLLTGKKMSIPQFSQKKNIPVRTLRRYLAPDKNMRQPIGSSVGRPSIVSNVSSHFMAELSIRADRANDGITRSVALNTFRELEPSLTDKQLENHFNRTFFQKHKDVIKKPVKAQQTTTKRSAITVSQQYRWFKLYQKGLQLLREKNTGVCRVTGKTFGELIHHFIIGGDETCFLANGDGDLCVIGDAKKRRHDKKIADSRASITMYRTGSVYGNNGPTGFLMKGQKRRTAYSDEFLIEHGCAEGSTVIMTENAYMVSQHLIIHFIHVLILTRYKYDYFS